MVPVVLQNHRVSTTKGSICLHFTKKADTSQKLLHHISDLSQGIKPKLCYWNHCISIYKTHKVAECFLKKQGRSSAVRVEMPRGSSVGVLQCSCCLGQVCLQAQSGGQLLVGSTWEPASVLQWRLNPGCQNQSTWSSKQQCRRAQRIWGQDCVSVAASGSGSDLLYLVIRCGGKSAFLECCHGKRYLHWCEVGDGQKSFQPHTILFTAHDPENSVSCMQRNTEPFVWGTGLPCCLVNIVTALTDL